MCILLGVPCDRSVCSHLGVTRWADWSAGILKTCQLLILMQHVLLMRGQQSLAVVYTLSWVILG
jgi:hypothetical protein